jgi:asparaginyl-tRNA synthetase
MTIFGRKNMALIAVICASVRRNARTVSAFQASRLTTQGVQYKPSSVGSAFGQRQSPATPASACFMSTTASSSDVTVIKRVKTADASISDEVVAIKGWVRTVRKQKTLAFVEVNDGSSLAGIQCVLPFDEIDEASNAEINKLTTGCSVEVNGRIVESKGKQKFEVASNSIKIVGECPGDTYPLAKKRHSLEYLRTIAHLRPRTNTIAAVARVRSTLAGAIHNFFQDSGFVYVQTPLITASDCEGAGEMFRVTTLDLDNVSELPIKKDEEGKETDGVDYDQDFFGKPAYLTVSGQLGGETHACALGDIYTFGPTFRAENSQTTRHLAEFNMVEPEMAFANLESAMDNAENMLKYVVGDVLKKCGDDLTFFTKFYDKGLKDRLEKVVSAPFVRVSYREAIGYLQEEIAKDPSKWQFPEVEFGTDLATEHERWLAETKFDSCVFVYNYPKNIKAFYMRDNDEDGGETVNAMDLLVPGVGELVGGSQREDRLDVLLEKMKILDLDPEDYWWYLDLRRYGSVPHAGYGLGFERLVCYVTAVENIREAIAYPRYPGNAEF